MLIANRTILDQYARSHPDAAVALKAWVLLVSEAKWKTSHEIKQRFATASFLHDNRVIFNVRGNKHRLIVQAIYVANVVRIVWIGTHAEYDKLRLE